MTKASIQIKGVLEKLYEKYNHRGLIQPDPLQFIYRFSEPSEMEIVGFIASALAYGRVQQIEKSLTDLFGRMNDKPYEFVRDFNARKRKKLETFKHRFTTGNDISDLLEVFKIVLDRFGSLEKYFLDGFKKTDRNIIDGLSNFCRGLIDMHISRNSTEPGRGLKYLLVSPAGGSCCKRLNLFLRWMVRGDDVDAGLWRSVDAAKLIVPIDVHMARLTRILGFHDKKTISLKTAVQITEAFAKIQPGDPVKYDFALSRIGIVENCTGKHTQYCPECELQKLCSKIQERQNAQG